MLKRSQINQAINQAIVCFNQHQYPLPPFAYWTPDDWQNKGQEFKEIRDTRIGWDVTDFDSGDFTNIGRTIFTLRNGRLNSVYPKTYAQKIMHLAEGQKSVIHYHQSKMEDIINNGGGNICLCFWKVAPDQKLSSEPLEIKIDGRSQIVPAGEEVKLLPGESVSIVPKTYHKFWAEVGKGDVLSMEVSSVCDDLTDNFWYEAAKRFPEILEDEPKQFILCSEY
jgi:D-lyxose ketol-isomerase